VRAALFKADSSTTLATLRTLLEPFAIAV